MILGLLEFYSTGKIKKSPRLREPQPEKAWTRITQPRTMQTRTLFAAQTNLSPSCNVTKHRASLSQTIRTLPSLAAGLVHTTTIMVV